MIKFLKSIYSCWSNPSPRKIYPLLLLHKAESSPTFSNKICTWYAFYRPKANLFCSKWPSSRVLRDCRSIFYLIVYSIHANCNNLIYCKNGLKRGNWTLRTIPFQHVLQKCSETSCTFLLPVLLYLYPIQTWGLLRPTRAKKLSNFKTVQARPTILATFPIIYLGTF